jgi:hypothetical protein
MGVLRCGVNKPQGRIESKKERNGGIKKEIERKERKKEKGNQLPLKHPTPPKASAPAAPSTQQCHPTA